MEVLVSLRATLAELENFRVRGVVRALAGALRANSGEDSNENR
ncbi:hypothetical protein HMPREF0576_1079 [Mobiluncus holmesii ATCC 35242]|uniref:Uncharacterized protein n=2 Tax=Mobiluncus TaxID=2050 RepID=E6M497_9ACTO|nr:hypothetical protein HMPREF0576_1079 [Mobiluncus holmesii ATCC 35242]